MQDTPDIKILYYGYLVPVLKRKKQAPKQLTCFVDVYAHSNDQRINQRFGIFNLVFNK